MKLISFSELTLEEKIQYVDYHYSPFTSSLDAMRCFNSAERGNPFITSAALKIIKKRYETSK